MRFTAERILTNKLFPFAHLLLRSTLIIAKREREPIREDIQYPRKVNRCLPHQKLSSETHLFDVVVIFLWNTLGWPLGNLNGKALLDSIKDLAILLARDKRERQTLRTETTGTTDTVEIRVGIIGEIVVDGDIDLSEIDSSPKDVGGDTNTGFIALELVVALDACKS